MECKCRIDIEKKLDKAKERLNDLIDSRSYETGLPTEFFVLKGKIQAYEEILNYNI